MESARAARPEPCNYENCGSRRFHVGDDGFTYCDRGHQQSERGTVIAEDTGELQARGVRSRKKDSDAESTTSRASGFSGARAFEHYLLCVQLVLRKQLRWLIDVQKLPDELETLVKDLWGLRLQKLRNRISYESDRDTEAESSQVFSSQSESETLTEWQSQTSRRSRKRTCQADGETPVLVETLGLCYIGTLLLRIPVTVDDIHRWMSDGELLYYRAPREVPLGMRVRLPPLYQELLEPAELLSPSSIHQTVLDTLTMLRIDYGMAVPAINTPLILYRWLQDLALPLEIFSVSQKLAQILSMDGNFHTNGSNVVLRYPEVRLMALVIVSAKLLLPFDGKQRSSLLAKDLSLPSLNWGEWAREQDRIDNEKSKDERLSFEKAFSFTESDCIEAADETLDAYLDWYSHNIATEEVRERGRAGKDADFRKALFRMFPILSELEREGGQSHPTALSDPEAEVRHVQNTLVPEPAPDHDQATRPDPPMGSFYRRFRKADDISGPCRVFYERASRLGGLSLEEMVQAVFVIERRLEKHEEALRRNAKRS